MTSARATARMLASVERRARMGQARSAQVRFNAVAIPDLITFADGSSTPPLFATHTSTMMPGGASPAGLTLPMLVVPLDGGGWVPVSYMPSTSDYLVATTVELPVQTVWHKGATWNGSRLTWHYQQVVHSAGDYAYQGFHVLGGSTEYLVACSLAYFGDVPSMVPSGAVVHSLKLALTRVSSPGTTMPGSPEHIGPASPWVSGHRYTPSSPPTASQAPAFSATTEWAQMRMGGTQQGDVWATDLLSGAIKGLAIGGSERAGNAAFSDLRLLITYTGGIAT